MKNVEQSLILIEVQIAALEKNAKTTRTTVNSTLRIRVAWGRKTAYMPRLSMT
jgi:hypothetical protein